MNNNAVIKKSNTLKNFRDTQYIIQSKLAKIIPSGTVLSYVANLPPNGWLICDGSEVSRQIYSKLFNVIGETYGAGDTETTFNLPNLTGRVVVGYDSSQTEFDQLGEMGGANTHTLTVDEIPSHNHGVTDPGHTHGYVDTFRSGNQNTDNVFGTETAADEPATNQNKTTNSSTTGITINNTGGGEAHNNLQPYTVLNYIIKI
jgi:microcystin-dependent protein